MKAIAMTTVLSAILLNLVSIKQAAVALTVNVTCRPPEPGVYTLGWGTSRLIIPKQGRPYYTFRGQRTIVKDTLCQSGDNVGVVAFRADGTVWAYVKAND